jgi:hypothetical protein
VAYTSDVRYAVTVGVLPSITTALANYVRAVENNAAYESPAAPLAIATWRAANNRSTVATLQNAMVAPASPGPVGQFTAVIAALSLTSPYEASIVVSATANGPDLDATTALITGTRHVRIRITHEPTGAFVDSPSVPVEVGISNAADSAPAALGGQLLAAMTAERTKIWDARHLVGDIATVGDYIAMLRDVELTEGFTASVQLFESALSTTPVPLTAPLLGIDYRMVITITHTASGITFSAAGSDLSPTITRQASALNTSLGVVTTAVDAIQTRMDTLINGEELADVVALGGATFATLEAYLLAAAGAFGTTGTPVETRLAGEVRFFTTATNPISILGTATPLAVGTFWYEIEVDRKVVNTTPTPEVIQQDATRTTVRASFTIVEDTP